jgi:hypothetical protein
VPIRDLWISLYPANGEPADIFVRLAPANETEGAKMPLRDNGDVRDVLIYVIGDTLGQARQHGGLKLKYPDLNADEAAVAHILDGITLHSLRGLIELRERQGWKR